MQSDQLQYVIRLMDCSAHMFISIKIVMEFYRGEYSTVVLLGSMIRLQISAQNLSFTVVKLVENIYEL